MKKFIFMIVAMLAIAVSATAQQTNYAGSSKFTDNVDLSLQGGVLTTADDFFSNHTACAPIVVLGVDKYVTPWLGFGVEGRTLIGTGKVNEARFNTKTVFDAVNVSGYLKVNLANAFWFNGTRHRFEPVIYTGLGWGHQTAGNYTYVEEDAEPVHVGHNNYMTWRSGLQMTYNFGAKRAWGVVANLSAVYGNPSTTQWATELNKHNLNPEATFGLVYHFGTSNGTHSFGKAVLYDAEVARLNARIAELEKRPVEVRTVVNEVEKIVQTNVETNYVVTFAQNSAILTDAAKAELDKVPTDATVDVVGTTSPEGTVKRNEALAQERANAVADYLKARGVTVNSAKGGEASRAVYVRSQSK